MAIELADKLYTSTQVADILGVSLRTLYRYMEDDKIKSMRTASGRHRFTKDHIIEFLNAGRSNSDEISSGFSGNNSPRNSGYSNLSQNQGQNQPTQRGTYTDNIQSMGNDMPNRYTQNDGFRGDLNQPAQARSNPYIQPSSSVLQNEETGQQSGKYEPAAAKSDDDFEFDVTTYDYDKDGVKPKDKDETPVGKFEDDFDNSDFIVSRSPYQPTQRKDDSQYGQNQRGPFSQVQPQSERPGYAPTTFAPASTENRSPIRSSAPEEGPLEARDLGTGLNVRYYKSDYSDLIELAKKIKDTSNAKDLEYAFTLYAGLSLHFLIRPFTVLNLYANPEDMQLWKDELRLVPSQKKEDANVGIIINTDIVFVPTKEIGGFKVVEDKILLKDLSSAREEDLVKQFRQHLTSL